MIESFDFTKRASSNPYTSAHFVISCSSPKAAEANRQVERLKLAKDFAEAKGMAVDTDGLVSSILLLQNLVTGPIPVPVASWDPESGASLFITQGDFYGDLEVSGNTIEYFLRWTEGQEPQEVYDSEQIEDGRLPPRLLTHLFSSFARTNANMP
jgi:hypothetical protein